MSPKRMVSILGLVVAGAVVSLAVATLQRSNAEPVVLADEVRGLIGENLGPIEQVRSGYARRPISTVSKPWDLFHGLLGRGGDFSISSEEGPSVSCKEWLLGTCAWQRTNDRVPLLVPREWGLSFTHGPMLGVPMEYEDHFCQFLWTLSEAGVDLKTETIRVLPDGQAHPLQEVVEGSERFCHGLSDVSWALPVFAQWSQHKKWKNKFDSTVSVEQLMQQHLAREDYCRSCFGTHWLMGLAQTLHLAGDRLSEPTRAMAEQRLSQAIKDARKSVLASGQFALQWGVWPPEVPESAGMPALPGEPADLISHQGHMLAWVLSALTDAQLAKEDWPHRAAQWLARALADMKDEDLKAVPYGAHSHAVQALRMYRQRVEKLTQGA